MVEARASSEVQNAEDELVELKGESGRKSEPQKLFPRSECADVPDCNLFFGGGATIISEKLKRNIMM